MLGVIPKEKESMLDGIENSVDNLLMYRFVSTKTVAVVTICPKESRELLMSQLSACDYISCSFDNNETAKNMTDEILKQIMDIDNDNCIACFDILKSQNQLDNMKMLYDYYQLELKKLELSEEFKCTDKTFVMEAWVPFDLTEKVEKSLDSLGSVLCMEFTEPDKEETFPTLTRNNKVVTPYESVTNMYSAPNSRELDPNPFVAIFFFMFFGMMISDAGYGLVLTAISLILIKLTKPRLNRGEGKMFYLILMGGISTIIWGILFCGWFGISIDPNTENPLGKFLLAISWFNPLDEPLMMLGVSLALGIVQILFGMGIQAYALIKANKALDAVLEIFTWYAVFLGIGLFAVKLVLHNNAVGIIGIIFIAIGVLGLMIAGGRGKKGFGMLLGGFGKLYGIVNFMSDILSYSRLFGLGLVTGVVGMVINLICGVLINLIPLHLGIIFAIPVLIVGHLFNIAINTLGAYVHNCRLQYIEFFSRFYTGAGHLFVPLGSTNKYTKIE